MSDLILVLKCFAKIGWELVLPAGILAVIAGLVLVIVSDKKGGKK